jgi:hypothetical protein
MVRRKVQRWHSLVIVVAGRLGFGLPATASFPERTATPLGLGKKMLCIFVALCFRVLGSGVDEGSQEIRSPPLPLVSVGSTTDIVATATIPPVFDQIVGLQSRNPRTDRGETVTLKGTRVGPNDMVRILTSPYRTNSCARRTPLFARYAPATFGIVEILMDRYFRRPAGYTPPTFGVLFTTTNAFFWSLNNPGHNVGFKVFTWDGWCESWPVPRDIRWNSYRLRIKALKRPNGEAFERVANSPWTFDYKHGNYSAPPRCELDAKQLRSMIQAPEATYYTGVEALIRFVQGEYRARDQSAALGRTFRRGMGAALTKRATVLFFHYVPPNLLLLQTEDGSTGLLVFEHADQSR